MDMDKDIPTDKPDGVDWEAWLDYKSKTRNQVIGLIFFLGTLGIVAGTIILLNWAPWA
jgi:hypothetical protein